MTGTARVIGFLLAAAVGGWAAPLAAQRGPGPQGPAGPNVGRSVDIVLEHQEDLDLTNDQVAQLRELQASLNEDVLPLAEELRTLRSAIREGSVDRTQGLRRLQALRGEMMTAAAPFRGRVQEILTAEQHTRLEALVRQNRPGAGGFGAGRPGPGRAGVFRGRGAGRGAWGRFMPRGVRGGSWPGPLGDGGLPSEGF